MRCTAIISVLPIATAITVAALLVATSLAQAEDAFQERTEVVESEGGATVAQLRAENARGEEALQRLTKWFDSHPGASMTLDFGPGASQTQVVHRPTSQRVQGVMLVSTEGAMYQPLDSPFFTLTSMATPSDVCLQGICGVLAALYSVTEILDVVDPKTVTNPDGTYKRDALKKARESAPAPGEDCGTTSHDNADIHRGLGGKKVRCDGNDTTYDHANAAASCRTLSNRVSAGEDCTGQLITASGITHFMPITDAQPIGGGVCSISMRDTTAQGDGNGNGVPANLAPMSWSLRPNMAGTGLSAFVAAGPNTHLWNGPGGLAPRTSEFKYLCCWVVP